MYSKLKQYLPNSLRTRLLAIKQNLRNFYKYGCFDMFQVIFLETITACNRRCSYCPNSKFDRGSIEKINKMEPGLFHKVIDELSELGWVGGIQPNFYNEPLLDDRLVSFLTYIRNKLPFSTIQLLTNGDFLTLDLYKELVKSGVEEFSITQHSQEMPANIKEVLGYRKEHGDSNVSLFYSKLSKLCNRGGLVKIEKTVKQGICEVPHRDFGVDYAGNVLFCCQDYFSTVKLGNLNSERLIDIWKKPYYKKQRNKARKGIHELEMCSKCEYQP